MQWPVITRTYEQLQRDATPSMPGQPECVPGTLYDSAAYVDNTTVQLTFFQTVKLNQGLSNMEVAGQLSAGKYFDVQGQCLDMVMPPTATKLAAWGDLYLMIFGLGTASIVVTSGAPYFIFTYNQKQYGPHPLSLLHSTGGILGSNGYGTTTADAVAEYQNNGPPDGGFPWSGALLLAPGKAFRCDVYWPTPVNTVADRLLRMTLVGTEYRGVQ